MIRTKIRKIMNRRVVAVAPETPLQDAVALMVRDRISSVVIVEEVKAVGIFTERDVVAAAGRGGHFGPQPIGEVMSRLIVTISSDTTVYEAYNLLIANSMRHHVVVDPSGAVAGVVSLSDMIRHLGLEYFVELRKIERIMTPVVVKAKRRTLVADVVAGMARDGISCTVIAERNQPVGIITERDVARFVVEGRDLGSLRAEEVMSAPVRTVSVDATVHSAVTAMQQHGIRRVVVVNGKGAIAGVVSQSDIVKGLEGKYIESLKSVIRDKEKALKKTTRELVDKGIYLDSILSSSIDMAIVATDSEFRIKYFNPAAERVFGYPAEEVIDRPVGEFYDRSGLTPERLARAKEFVRKKGAYNFTVRREREDGTRFFESRVSGIRDSKRRLAGFVLMLRDVTERKRDEETIRHMAFHDALTGLPNRLLLHDRLSQALAHASRNRHSGAIIMIDLDRFKEINDTLGHSMGDLLLKDVGSRLVGLLRKSDTVARMGGDEFVLLLPTIASRESTDVIGNKIVSALRKPFVCDGHTLLITTSAGIAIFPDDGNDAETLLKNADIAMYRAKEEGRDSCRHFAELV